MDGRKIIIPTPPPQVKWKDLHKDNSEGLTHFLWNFKDLRTKFSYLKRKRIWLKLSVPPELIETSYYICKSFSLKVWSEQGECFLGTRYEMQNRYPVLCCLIRNSIPWDGIEVYNYLNTGTGRWRSCSGQSMRAIGELWLESSGRSMFMESTKFPIEIENSNDSTPSGGYQCHIIMSPSV